jgi:two-component system chemotaxis response regulator CheV
MPGVTSYITGSVQIQDRLVMVLDLEHLMSVITPHLGIQASIEKMAQVPKNKRREGITIMFAEDSTLIRRMTSDQLRQAGFTQLLIFENGLRAHDQFMEFHAQSKATGEPITRFVNLILTDIEMPQMDGLTLCKTIKKDLHYADLPIVIYSSLINEQMAIKCQAVGSNAYISKPKIEHIISIIDQECHLLGS